MFEQKKTVETHIEPAARAEWKRPQVCRMSAGDAELGTIAGGDGINLVS
jgi:hypothetical protein